MEALTNVLYAVSTGLMVPVIVALLGGFTWAVLHIGGLIGEYGDRRKGHVALRRAVEDIKLGRRDPRRGDPEVPSSVPRLRGPVARFLEDAKGGALSEVLLGKVIDDLQIGMDERIARVGVGTRLGPMFGLMGTLIPMGPALTGLASGDVAEMSRGLVVAFSTTVLGLMIGGICYVVTAVRGRWYAQDMSDIEFLHDLIIIRARERGEMPS